MIGRNVETLEPCLWCDGNVRCEWCDGAGKVWIERCYMGNLNLAAFAYWQIRMADGPWTATLSATLNGINARGVTIRMAITTIMLPISS